MGAIGRTREWGVVEVILCILCLGVLPREVYPVRVSVGVICDGRIRVRGRRRRWCVEKILDSRALMWGVGIPDRPREIQWRVMGQLVSILRG